MRAGLNREQETPVWLLVLGAKNPNGRVAATNEGAVAFLF